MRRQSQVVVASCTIMLLTGLLLVTPAAAGPRARNSDQVATGKSLVTQFFNLVKKKDTAGLDKMLSPAFQLERADGSGLSKAEYLENLPTLIGFDLTDFSAGRAGSVLVVRYLATATGVVNDKPYTPGPAPRLSVFMRNGKRWQIVAHANFNPLTG
jgi:hypothetical protein